MGGCCVPADFLAGSAKQAGGTHVAKVAVELSGVGVAEGVVEERDFSLGRAAVTPVPEQGLLLKRQLPGRHTGGRLAASSRSPTSPTQRQEGRQLPPPVRAVWGGGGAIAVWGGGGRLQLQRQPDAPRSLRCALQGVQARPDC